MTKIGDIYKFLDNIAPYNLQENYDNSGLLLGDFEINVNKILVALDCTIQVAQEAIARSCQLVVTHHPIIFNPLKNIDFTSPVGLLTSEKISALCTHTNFDSAFMNDILCEKLGLKPLEPLAAENNASIGYICTCSKISPKDLGIRIKRSLGNPVVRFNNCGKNIERVAVCSGSGGSLLKYAIGKKCHAFITGDVKHDVFIEGNNQGISIFDGGHFYTENIFCEFITGKLLQNFPDIEVEIAENNLDITSYIV